MGNFYRIKKDSIIGGVCSGISKYFNISDWTWVIRILFLLFLSKESLIIYILIWILTKEK